MTVKERIAALRARMKETGIDAYLIPTDDFHGSEYVGEYFKCRKYITGFTGSAGTAVIMQDMAGLWTDGRYFIQAADQLEGTGITLFKMGEPEVPTVHEFLKKNLTQGMCLGFDGRTVSAKEAAELEKMLDENGVSLSVDHDLAGDIWENRPVLSCEPVTELDIKWAGESRADKCARIRKAMEKKGADLFVLTSLDDIAWLLNIRGGDIHCCPVVLSYLVMTKTEIRLFANEKAFQTDVLEALEKDTLSHSRLVLILPERICYIGNSAIKSLKGRARIDGKALADVDKKTLAEILNKCLKVARGRALIRFCEGKIRAVLSGDEKDYAIISMPDMYMVTSAYIHGDYEKATFLNGYADHYSVTASWQLEDTKLTDVYKELMQNYGRKTDKDIKAVVRITTSDVGVSGANIFYSLQEPTRNVILGNALKVTHKNCKGMEDFTENIESIFDYYREVLKGVMRLCDIWIEHPANAMAGIMKQAGFGKKLLAETVEQFKATTGNEPCSAYEIYHCKAGKDE